MPSPEKAARRASKKKKEKEAMDKGKKLKLLEQLTLERGKRAEKKLQAEGCNLCDGDCRWDGDGPCTLRGDY